MVGYIEVTKKSINGEYKQFCKHMNPTDLDNLSQIWAAHQKQKLIPKNEIKMRTANPNFATALLLVDSALHYSTKQKHRLRATQALAIFCFIFKPEHKKIVLEILTGEGKSVTIACLAAILVMQGKTVDVITTNELLAKRDVQDKAEFYALLGISVAHNFAE